MVTTTRAPPSGKELGPTTLCGLRHGKARAQRLLEKGLQERGHRANPERMDDEEMLGPADYLQGLGDGRRRRALVPLPFRAQDRKIEIGDGDGLNLVSCAKGALRIGLRQGVAKMRGPARWMTL